MILPESTDLGITKSQLAAMQKRINTLELENDAISNRHIRHAISERLVEIRLLLRDGHLKNKNGGQPPDLLEALQYAIKQVPELATVPGSAAAIARAKGEV